MSVWRSFIFFNKIIKFEKFRLTDLESLFAHPSCRVGEESWCLNVPGRNFGHIVLCVVALLFGVFVKWIFLPITIYCSYFVGHYRLGGFYRHVFIRLYVQYVRPHIEFAVPAWSPWLEADKEVLEKVQRRAVQMVSGLKAHTYEDRLKELGLTTLEERRHQADMAQTYKIVKERKRHGEQGDMV